MNITKHITFFYVEERIPYIERLIQEASKYKYITDIFIHTNKNDFKIDIFDKYINGEIYVIYHDLTNVNPFTLTTKSRDLLCKQKNDYDIFMYIEDDMLFPCQALEYWLQHNESLIELNYNLGFVRIETKDNEEYITDLYGEQMDKIITIKNKRYVVNNKNPYCAMWIYNKKEFNKFVESKYYNLCEIEGYGEREACAIGLHGKYTSWYKDTIIPLVDNHLDYSCKIYHLPNNYVNADHSGINKFATIKFNDAISMCVNV